MARIRKPKKAERKRAARKPAAEQKLDKAVAQLKERIERFAAVGQHAEAAALTDAVALLRGEEDEVDGTEAVA